MRDSVVLTNLCLTRYGEQRNAYLRGGFKGWLTSNHVLKLHLMTFSLKSWIGVGNNSCQPHMMRSELSGCTFIFMGGTKPIDPPSSIWETLGNDLKVKTGTVRTNLTLKYGMRHRVTWGGEKKRKKKNSISFTNDVQVAWF